MNRRVTFVTALSVAGTAAVAAMSFAIVYEPADDPSAGVPLLDTTIATIATPATGDAPTVEGTRLPTSLNPAAPIVAAPVAAGPAGPVTAPAPGPAAPGQGGRSPAAAAPAATAAPATSPVTSPVTSPSPTGGAQPPATTAAPATTTAPTPAGTTAATITTSPTVTTAPAPVTTAATRPEGVPVDWPANKPIPPMPAGCVEPQLEDNGVWNCQH